MIGITVKAGIGLGDGLQFSSVPENYYRATGKRLVDLSRPWFFDFNPFVDRDPASVPKVTKKVELWNFGPTQRQWPTPRPADKPQVYLSNAEAHAAIFNVPTVLNRPRLYVHESFPFHERQAVLLQVHGKSHGELPAAVVEHVVQKYRPTGHLYAIGLENPNVPGVPFLPAVDFWQLAEIISKARMLIGPDSGPGWIAACYPDVILKVLRLKHSPDALKTWIPLEIRNVHAHWDDRCRQAFNPTADDIGFTWSYRKL